MLNFNGIKCAVMVNLNVIKPQMVNLNTIKPLLVNLNGIKPSDVKFEQLPIQTIYVVKTVES